MGFIIGSSLAFSVGSVFMKSSKGFTNLAPSAVVSACFVLGAFLIARAVKTNALSSSIILGLGIEAVFTVCLGVLVVGDRISALQGVGIAMVACGVAMLRIG
jgi:multidrug transporter EmrE-like cation transporter